MELRVFGSGSQGNTYSLMAHTGETIILDAGVNPKEVLRHHLPNSIAGVLITHSHGDHAKYVQKYKDRFVDVYMPEEMGGTIKHQSKFKVGTFEVISFVLKHDVPCLGYLIRHPEVADPILYATDTNGIPYTFKSLSLALIEADYEEKRLKENISLGVVEKCRATRITATHQSINQAISFATKQVGRISHIILCHLSKDNSNGEEFKEKMEREAGVETEIAKEGLKYEFLPF